MKMAKHARVALLVVIVTTCGYLRANTVTEWNQFAVATLRPSPWPLLEKERALTIVQLAVYEAANAADPRYSPSATAVPAAAGASVDAAVSEAAYRTLLALVPAERARLEGERDKHLASLPKGTAKDAGVRVGDAAAETVLRSRAADGADWATTYVPGSGAGAYVLTGDEPIASPLAARMKPFVLQSAADLRPPPPPALDSAQMKRDMEEVKNWGSKTSKVRSAEQTEIGRFHEAPGVFQWSAIVREAIAARHLDDVESARVFALAYCALMDAHLAIWDAKFHYNLWRPITAIRATGGENATWTPLIETPPHPEYPCAHCAVGAAMKTVLEGLLGDGPITFSLTNGTVTRSYHSFRQYADEESRSRVYAGAHFRWSRYVGEDMGRQVGERVLESAPKALRSP